MERGPREIRGRKRDFHGLRNLKVVKRSGLGKELMAHDAVLLNSTSRTQSPVAPTIFVQLPIERNFLKVMTGRIK